MHRKRINLSAPINELGYGQVGKNIYKELSQIADVFLIPIGTHAQSMPHHDAISLRIWHQNDLMTHVGRGAKIGWPIFELDTFTEVEKHHLSYCDTLIVCSEWAKQVIKDNGINVETAVVPLGIDPSIFYPSSFVKEGPYKFFTAGKWEIRKGHDVLLQAFEAAFNEEDDVELHLLCNNPFPQCNSAAWERYYKTSRLGNKITIHPRQETQQDVANLMRQMDCGVFLSRAEGFNLELLECMACGLDIVYTDYSGHTEFARGRAVYTDKREKANDGVWFHGQGNWLYLDDCLDQIVEHMRDAYEHRNRTDAIISGRRHLYTWQNSAKKLLTHLNQ